MHSECEGSVLDVAPDMSSGSSFVACKVSVEGGVWLGDVQRHLQLQSAHCEHMTSIGAR